MTRLRLASSLAALTLLVACSGDDPEPGAEPEALPASVVDCRAGTATASGSFVTPSGAPIVGALATIASAPGCQASTDGAGAFELRNVPASASTVSLARGAFGAAAAVTPGTPVVVQVDSGAVSIAFAYSAYDAVEELVSELGFWPTELSMGDVSTADLSQYDVILLNGGVDPGYLGAATTDALAGWVNAGGRLYAADYAASYVEAAFPGRVRLLAPEFDVGQAGTAAAELLDEALVRALGTATAQVEFVQDYWVVVDGVVVDGAGAGAEVLVRGPADLMEGETLSARPYAVRFRAGAGVVTYTSFHEDLNQTADATALLQHLVMGP